MPIPVRSAMASIGSALVSSRRWASITRWPMSHRAGKCPGARRSGADKAALKLATLDHPVKKMIGGVTGWLDEGFPLVEGDR